MKKLFAFCVLTLVLGLISCSADSGTPTTDGSTLIIEPDTLILTAADSAKTLDLTLSCGCGFTCEVTTATGDTNVITYAHAGNPSEKQSLHQINFSYSPSAFASGKYSIKLDFLAKKKTYSYTNSVVVEVR